MLRVIPLGRHLRSGGEEALLARRKRAASSRSTRRSGCPAMRSSERSSSALWFHGRLHHLAFRQKARVWGYVRGDTGRPLAVLDFSRYLADRRPKPDNNTPKTPSVRLPWVQRTSSSRQASLKRALRLSSLVSCFQNSHFLRAFRFLCPLLGKVQFDSTGTANGSLQSTPNTAT